MAGRQLKDWLPPWGKNLKSFSARGKGPLDDIASEGLRIATKKMQELMQEGDTGTTTTEPKQPGQPEGQGQEPPSADTSQPEGPSPKAETDASHAATATQPEQQGEAEPQWQLPLVNVKTESQRQAIVKQHGAVIGQMEARGELIFAKDDAERDRIIGKEKRARLISYLSQKYGDGIKSLLSTGKLVVFATQEDARRFVGEEELKSFVSRRRLLVLATNGELRNLLEKSSRKELDNLISQGKLIFATERDAKMFRESLPGENSGLPGKSSVTQGFARNGKIYLVADHLVTDSRQDPKTRLEDRDQVSAVFHHELGVHLAGLGFRDSDAFKDFSRSLWDRRNEDSATGRAINEALKSVLKEYNGNRAPKERLTLDEFKKLDLDTTDAKDGTANARALSEIAAYMVENAIRDRKSTPTVWRSFVAALRRFMTERGFSGILGKMTTDDMVALAQGAIRREINDARRAGDRANQGAVARLGSTDTGRYSTLFSLVEGGRSKDALLSAIRNGIHRGDQAASENARGTVKDLQLEAIRLEAQANGSWIDDVHDLTTGDTEVFEPGYESEVYPAKHPNTLEPTHVIKVNSLRTAENVPDFLARIAAHNKHYPDLAYRILGFTENTHGATSIVLQQPLVETTGRHATQDAINKHLSDDGYVRVPGVVGASGSDTWRKTDADGNTTEISDARPANVLPGKDGDLYFIDTLIHDSAFDNKTPEKLLNIINPQEGIDNEAASVGGEGVRYSIADEANSERTPKTRLAELAEHTDWSVRRSVASNPNTPHESLAKLAKDQDDIIRGAVATHQEVSPQILSGLSKDNSEYVRRFVAKNPKTPSGDLTNLAGDENSSVRRDVANNPSTPLNALTTLASDDSSAVRFTVAHNPNSTPELLAKLASDEDIDVVSAVAENGSTSAETLAKVADNEDWLLRCRVASNPNTTPEILAKLADDKNPSVLWDIISNPNTTPKILAKLADFDDTDIRQRIAESPKTSPDTLAKLANDEYEGLRWTVASNPNTAPETLAKLTDDEDHSVRWKVAENPKTSPESLAKLADSPNNNIRASVASNPSTAPETLAKLADDRASFVKLNIARNPKTPAEILTTQADTDSPALRIAVAGNPSAPKELITKLANDENISVVHTALANPSFPESVAEEMLNKAKGDPQANAATIRALLDSGKIKIDSVNDATIEGVSRWRREVGQFIKRLNGAIPTKLTEAAKITGLPKSDIETLISRAVGKETLADWRKRDFLDLSALEDSTVGEYRIMPPKVREGAQAISDSSDMALSFFVPDLDGNPELTQAVNAIHKTQTGSGHPAGFGFVLYTPFEENGKRAAVITETQSDVMSLLFDKDKEGEAKKVFGDQFKALKDAASAKKNTWAKSLFRNAIRYLLNNEADKVYAVTPDYLNDELGASPPASVIADTIGEKSAKLEGFGKSVTINVNGERVEAWDAIGRDSDIGAEVRFSLSDEQRVANIVDIDPSLIVDDEQRPISIRNTGKLRQWLSDRYEGLPVRISDDNTLQVFDNDGFRASLKKRRSDARRLYANLDDILKNALYDDFRPADKRHEGKVLGQNIYYSAARIGGQIFSVKFYIDLPISGRKSPYYKEHAIRKIEIAPSLYQGGAISQEAFPSPYQRYHAEATGEALRAEGATSEIAQPQPSAETDLAPSGEQPIHGVSLAVLKDSVKPSRIDDGILYSLAGGPAVWTDKRVDHLIHKYAWPGPNKTKAMAIRMSPRDFVRMTTSQDYEPQIWDQTKPLDEQRLRREGQEIQLYVDSVGDNLTVVDHEGRHRAAALANSGASSIPVSVIFNRPRDFADQKMLSDLRLYPQFDNGSPIHVDAVPISNGNVQELRSMFGEESSGATDQGIRFSLASPVEEKNDLIAVHNLEESEIKGALELGGFPMPSIAIIRGEAGHTDFGNISVVFGKETIDPKASRYNRVYSGDAWTPTFPPIGYEINNNKARALAKSFDDTLSRHGLDVAYRYRHLSSEGAAEAGKGDIAAGMRNNEATRLVYALETDPKFEADSTPIKISPENQAILDEFGGPDGIKSAMALDNNVKATEANRDALKENISRLAKVLGDWSGHPDAYSAEKMGLREHDRYLNAALEEARDVAAGKRNVDTQATNNLVNEVINRDPAAYEAWLADKTDGLLLSKGVRNQTDPFTRAGNRRGFSALYDDFTLDNIVKAMRKQPQVGDGGGILGAAQLPLRNIAAIRAAKDRIGAVDQETYDALKGKIREDAYAAAWDIAEHLDPLRDQSRSADSIEDTIIEALRKGRRTASAIKDYVNSAFSATIGKDGKGGMTDAEAETVANIVERAANLPTEFFEAKPARAVSLDEVKAVIAPTDTDPAILSDLRDRGIPVTEYTPGDDTERIKALNDVPSNIRFSMASRATDEGVPQEQLDREFVDTERAHGGRDAFNRAVDTGRTKLNYRQWVQVRTPRFLDWFGDWQLANLEKTMRYTPGSKLANNVRSKIINKPLTNLETGIVASVSRTSWDKMMSKSNVERSVSPSAHMQALGNIDTLFRLAILREEPRTGKKPQDAGTIASMRHFIMPMPFNDDVLQVRIMAKEFRQARQGNRLYLVEAVEIEKTPEAFRVETSLEEERSRNRLPGVSDIERLGGDASAPGQFQNGTKPVSPPLSGSPTSTSTGVSDKFTQMVAAVKGYSVSKVVDPDTGEPMIVYHGTNADFSSFGQRPRMIHGEEITAPEGLIFAAAEPPVAGAFARDREITQGGAANIMPLFMAVKNPIDLTDINLNHEIADAAGIELPGGYTTESAFNLLEQPDALAVIKARGHDGAILNESGRQFVSYRAAADHDASTETVSDFSGMRSYPARTFAVFDPTQIKSATGNTGAFDAGNPDTRYSMAWHGSPHRGIEDEGFRLEKIGTGEGAQVYGHGIYFGGARDTGEYYRTAGQRSTIGIAENLARQAFPSDDFRNIASTVVRAGIHNISAFDLQSQYPFLRDLDRRKLQRVIDDYKRETSGQLYSAEIPDDNELLDWDKPLSEQPEKVKAALEKAFSLASFNKDFATAGDFYQSRARKFNSPEAASRELNDLGIPGLRYLDQGSRNAGEGTHNYVIWDESRLNNDIKTYYSLGDKDARRTNPESYISFPHSIIGPSGNRIIGYEWKWRDGTATVGDEIRNKRVSDWDRAGTSAATGRDIVHQFHVAKPNGNVAIVSAESAVKLLGYDNLKDSGLSGTVSAAKTLASLEMQLAEARSALASAEAIREQVRALPTPAISEAPEDEKLGLLKGKPALKASGEGVTYIEGIGYQGDDAARKRLIDGWRDEVETKRGGGRTIIDKAAREERDLESRATKQRRKVASEAGNVKSAEPPQQPQQRTLFSLAGERQPSLKDLIDEETKTHEYAATDQIYGGKKAYDRALSDGETGLSRKQWVTSRTPGFLASFGNWIAGHGVERLDAKNPLVLDNAKPVKGKEEVKDVFRRLGEVENTNDKRKVIFPTSMAGKVISHKGFDTKRIIDSFGQLFADAVPMEPEPVRRETGKNDQSRSLNAYHNYVGKFSLDGEPYYIRFTVHEEKSGMRGRGRNIAHSSFVSSVSIYEKDAAQVTASFREENPGLTDVGATSKDDRLAQWLKEGKIFNANPRPLDAKTGEPLAANVDAYIQQEPHQTPAEEREGRSSETRFSLREEPPPEKTRKAYKLFRVAPDGNLRALFIGREEPIQPGLWYDAEAPSHIDIIKSLPPGIYTQSQDGTIGKIEKIPSRTELGNLDRQGVKVIQRTETTTRVAGVNGSGSVSWYAMRPGWHSSNAPSAPHIGTQDRTAENPRTAPLRRRSDEVWAEVEVPDDVDWQRQADENGRREDGSVSPRDAQISNQIPKDGYYRYRTNSRADEKQDWLISGAVKVNRILNDNEVAAINKVGGFRPDAQREDANARPWENARDTDIRYSFSAADQPLPSAPFVISAESEDPTGDLARQVGEKTIDAGFFSSRPFAEILSGLHVAVRKNNETGDTLRDMARALGNGSIDERVIGALASIAGGKDMPIVKRAARELGEWFVKNGTIATQANRRALIDTMSDTQRAAMVASAFGGSSFRDVMARQIADEARASTPTGPDPAIVSEAQARIAAGEDREDVVTSSGFMLNENGRMAFVVLPDMLTMQDSAQFPLPDETTLGQLFDSSSPLFEAFPVLSDAPVITADGVPDIWNGAWPPKFVLPVNTDAQTATAALQNAIQQSLRIPLDSIDRVRLNGNIANSTIMAQPGVDVDAFRDATGISIIRKDPATDHVVTAQSISRDIGGTGIPDSIGKESTILFGGKNDPLTTRYEVWPLSDIITSHNPNDSFEPTPNYPEGVQERDYRGDKLEQGKVGRYSGKTDMRAISSLKNRRVDSYPASWYSCE